MDFRVYFKSRQGEMVKLLKTLVSLESPSDDKKAVDSCSKFVAEEFEKAGARFTCYPQKKIGDLYVIEYPVSKEKEYEEKILLLLHTDTVWPVGKIKTMPFYLSGDKVFGPGVLDMKASLVMAIYAIRTLNYLNLKPKKKIIIFLNSAEEIQSESSSELIRSLARKSSYVLCLEPSLPQGALKVKRKGRLVIRLETKGKSAHAGSPQEGVNAIDELMRQLRRLQQLRTRQTTINIGQIGGGEKPNVVAERAWAILDIRFWKKNDQLKILNFLKTLKPTLKGAQVKFSIESSTPPLERTKKSSLLIQKVKKIASTLDLNLGEGKTGGGSDACIASELDVATVDGLGPEGDGIHAEHEHLLLHSLILKTALLTEILRQL